MKNSILVAVDRWHMHSKYKLKVKRTSKLMVGQRSWLCRCCRLCRAAWPAFNTQGAASRFAVHECIWPRAQAHDEGNECNVGDRVKISSCR